MLRMNIPWGWLGGCWLAALVPPPFAQLGTRHTTPWATLACPKCWPQCHCHSATMHQPLFIPALCNQSQASKSETHSRGQSGSHCAAAKPIPKMPIAFLFQKLIRAEGSCHHQCSHSLAHSQDQNVLCQFNMTRTYFGMLSSNRILGPANL